MQGERRNVNTESKYRESVSLYTTSGLSIKEICKQTGVGFSAFSSYLSKHHRKLILEHHNLAGFNDVKLRGKKGQTTGAYYKYREAIVACDSEEYLEYNISQIARIFGLDCSSLANQLRRHYPEIVSRREQARQRMGIIPHTQCGLRELCRKEYADAIEMLQSSDMTIGEVADACNVSYSGLREHILAYHPQITLLRERKRTDAAGLKERGKRSGNWSICEPYKSTIEKYEKAIELYRTTSKDVKEIARMAGVNPGGLRYHMRRWHPALIVQRRGFDESVDIAQTKRYKKSAVEKYAAAIQRLGTSDLPTAKVAAEFNLNPEVFRMYLKEHHPDLLVSRSMARATNGKVMSTHSAGKYAEALQIYETTHEPLKSIAQRLGVTYNSLGKFIRRNYPEAIERHNLLLATTDKRLQEEPDKLMNRDTVNSGKRGYGGTKAADKYASAIEELHNTSETMKNIAARFGLNISSFRKYLYKHAPEMLKSRRTGLKTDICN